MSLGRRVRAQSDVVIREQPRGWNEGEGASRASDSASVPASPQLLGSPHGTNPHFGRLEAESSSTAPPTREPEFLSPSGLKRKQCPVCSERYPGDFRHCPRDATQLVEASADDTDPLLGCVLGDTYQVLRVIGQGGMSRVYEARHMRLTSKRVAIKVLHGDLTRETEVLGRFLREAEATGALQHPNIVGAIDVNELTDGRPYIVSELLEGDQLGAYFERRGKLSVEEAVGICRPICRALIAAHEKGIVHRDIKPENLFLVGEGAARTTKVLDFGISQVGTTQNKLTKTGTVMGTPTYMPPEQARGKRVDHRADVYSVGAILYEAVTGKRPFDGTEPMATLAAVLTEDPTRPRSLVPNLPPGLELVIQKSMAKLPKDRYATMRELDDALAEFDPAARASGDATDAGRRSAPLHVMGPRLETQFFRMWGGVYNALEQARTSLVIYSVCAALYLLFGCLEVSLGVVRVARGSAPLTSAEIAFAGLASLGLLVAPSIIWTWFLAKHVWSSTPRVMEVLDRVRHVLGASLGVYAGLTLLIRIAASTLHIDPSGIAWPGWGVLSFILAAIVGGIATRGTLQARALAK
jgi:tRNA A-37 threonylcarbamoyl transferase component Bud32